MKIILATLLICLIIEGCFMFENRDDKIRILSEYSKIEFSDTSLRVLKFSKLTGGLFHKEKSISALYVINDNVDLKILKDKLLSLDYKPLPINKEDGILEKNFSPYLNIGDKGFYKIILITKIPSKNG